MRFSHKHHGHQGGHHEHPIFSSLRGRGRGFFGFDLEGRHGGHRRRQRLFDGDELRLILLKLIADQSRHGYDLIRAIEELSGGNYVPSAGVVYPALSVLQDLGHIDEVESAGARKVFAVSPAGSTELAAQEQKVTELFARLSALATATGGVDIAPVRRAMENLRTVLQLRLRDEGVDKNVTYDIAAILDEAAQRIERL